MTKLPERARELSAKCVKVRDKCPPGFVRDLFHDASCVLWNYYIRNAGK